MPLHYCYGLSVLHSHLVAGASLLLTERSVVEDEFWAELRRGGGDLVRRGAVHVRPARRDGLRRPAGAGAALHHPGRRPAGPGPRAGLRPPGPASAASTSSSCTGRPRRRRGWPTCRRTWPSRPPGPSASPVPGSRLRVDAAPGEDVGELVFSGPGVMLGYAEDPADLALGRDGARAADRRPGPAARRTACSRCVGRADRVVKVFGLRVDLDRVEALLGSDRVPVRAVAVGRAARAVRHRGPPRSAASAPGRPSCSALPPHARAGARGRPVPAHLDGQAGPPRPLARYAARLDRSAAPAARRGRRRRGPRAVPGAARAPRRRPRGLLRRAWTGDSLSYVEVSHPAGGPAGRPAAGLAVDCPRASSARCSPGPPARPAAARPAGRTPRRAADGRPDARPTATGRPQRPVASAGARPAAARAVARRAGPRVETPTLLRALAIVLVVGTHADAFTRPGRGAPAARRGRLQPRPVPARRRAGPVAGRPAAAAARSPSCCPPRCGSGRWRAHRLLPPHHGAAAHQRRLLRRGVDGAVAVLVPRGRGVGDPRPGRAARRPRAGPARAARTRTRVALAVLLARPRAAGRAGRRPARRADGALQRPRPAVGGRAGLAGGALAHRAGPGRGRACSPARLGGRVPRRARCARPSSSAGVLLLVWVPSLPVPRALVPRSACSRARRCSSTCRTGRCTRRSRSPRRGWGWCCRWPSGSWCGRRGRPPARRPARGCAGSLRAAGARARRRRPGAAAPVARSPGRGRRRRPRDADPGPGPGAQPARGRAGAARPGAAPGRRRRGRPRSPRRGRPPRPAWRSGAARSTGPGRRPGGRRTWAGRTMASTAPAAGAAARSWRTSSRPNAAAARRTPSRRAGSRSAAPEERGHGRGDRVVEHRGGLAPLQQLAVGQDADGVAERQRLLLVVRDEDRGDAGVLERVDHGPAGLLAQARCPGR